MADHNSTAVDLAFSLETSQICGAFLLIVSLFGLMVYVLFMFVVFTRPKFKDKTYFTIAGCLGIADCMCLFLMIGYASPCLFYRTSLSNSLALGGVLNIGWFSGLPLLIFLAGDRYLCICNKDLYSRFYKKRLTNMYCIGCWVFGIAYSIPSFFPCCSLHFDYTLMSWGWSIDFDGAKTLALGEITMVVIITSITYFLNGLVFRALREAQRNTSLDAVHEQRKSARERKVFIQFFITTIWLVVFDVPFITIGYIENPSHWLGYFVTLAYTINCSINGWVYCFMNKTVKREIREICRRGYRIRADTEMSDQGRKTIVRQRKDTKKSEVENFRLKQGNTSSA
eukprot:TCONS_00000996-protein